MLAAVAGVAMLGSFGFRTRALAPKPGRMNPLAGVRRMFGAHGLVELGKALAKTLVLGALGLWVVAGDLPAMVALDGDDIAAGGKAGAIMVRAVLWLALGLLLIGAVDVPIQLVERTRRLRMTRQQVKEELRQSEGSPELKRHIRQRQAAAASGSVRKALDEASVVLTNPTHFAVALRYLPGRDTAPVVVARGRDELAPIIRALAAERGVPTLEYPQLARAIYYTSRVGRPIAEDLYVAVATILGFVFNMERAMANGVAMPSIDVPPAKRFDENGRL